MTQQEMSDIFLSIEKLKLAEMDVQDQITCITAFSQFAETLKPLVVKYIDKVPTGNTFLFKL